MTETKTGTSLTVAMLDNLVLRTERRTPLETVPAGLFVRELLRRQQGHPVATHLWWQARPDGTHQYYYGETPLCDDVTGMPLTVEGLGA